VELILIDNIQTVIEESINVLCKIYWAKLQTTKRSRKIITEWIFIIYYYRWLYYYSNLVNSSNSKYLHYLKLKSDNWL